MTVPPSQPPFVASKISQKIKKEMALFPNLFEVMLKYCGKIGTKKTKNKVQENSSLNLAKKISMTSNKFGNSAISFLIF